MKTLSAKKLAETVKMLREERGLTKIELGNLTGLNKILVGRIENEDFVPSISQFEELAKVLGFEVSNMFAERESFNSYTSLISETINDVEKEGVDRFFKMMIALRQQVILRRKYLNESGYNAI